MVTWYMASPCLRLEEDEALRLRGAARDLRDRLDLSGC
jgi:hypothetical protein